MSRELRDHYAQLLGLDSFWLVDDVNLDPDGRRVSIRLEGVSGAQLDCPDCGAQSGRHDLAPERTWRHLDTMGFETVLVARLPRCRCSAISRRPSGVKLRSPHSNPTKVGSGRPGLPK